MTNQPVRRQIQGLVLHQMPYPRIGVVASQRVENRVGYQVWQIGEMISRHIEDQVEDQL